MHTTAPALTAAQLARSASPLACAMRASIAAWSALRVELTIAYTFAIREAYAAATAEGATGPTPAEQAAGDISLRATVCGMGRDAIETALAYYIARGTPPVVLEHTMPETPQRIDVLLAETLSDAAAEVNALAAELWGRSELAPVEQRVAA